MFPTDLESLKKMFTCRVHLPLIRNSMARKVRELEIRLVFMVEEDSIAIAVATAVVTKTFIVLITVTVITIAVTPVEATDVILSISTITPTGSTGTERS